MFKGKITIIGTGYVGSTTAYTLMTGGLASEIVLIDINKDRAEGDAMDMNHGISFVSPVQIYSGEYSDIKGSSIIIICAGVGQKPGETRVDLLKRNTEVFKSIIGEIQRNCDKDAIILVVTNPVDILTYITYKISDFPKNKVIGSGTVLDSSRLKFLISEHTNVDARNIHTYIIGEHGDTEVAAFSATSIAGMTLEEYCSICKNSCDSKRICKEEFYNKTKNAAYEIISKKGATYYAVALAVRRIVECITGNENSILTVSSYLDGEYGINDICLSVPTIVNSSGADRILQVPFADNEIEKLKYSASILKQLVSEVGV